MQVACFQIGDAEFALDIMRVKEVVNPLAVTRVPHAPAFVEGLIDLRGVFIPVIDLRRRFGLPSTAKQKVVVALFEDHRVGLIVDGVTEVVHIDPDAIQAPPEMAIGEQARFLVGVAKVGDRVVMILDLDCVLSNGELGQLAEMERGNE